MNPRRCNDLILDSTRVVMSCGVERRCMGWGAGGEAFIGERVGEDVFVENVD